jgi:hypothetical protein
MVLPRYVFEVDEYVLYEAQAAVVKVKVGDGGF